MTLRKTQLAVALVGSSLTLAAGAAAQPEPGAWYLVDVVEGAVIDFSAGGDLTSAPRFATGLPNAVGMCYGGPNGDLYVATPYLNAVYRITAGGDFSGALPHAYQFPGFTTAGFGAMTLDCTASRVLVGVPETGAIFDVTAGGDMTAATPFATGLPAGGLADVFTDSSGTVWATVETAGVYDVSAGGDLSAASPTYGYDLAMSGVAQLAELDGSLYVNHIYPGTVLDITDLHPGDALSTAATFAGGFDVGFGLESNGDLLLVGNPCPAMSCGNGTIVDATAGGDLTGADPFAYGFNGGNHLSEAMAYIHYCGDGIVWPNSDEECDEGGETVGCNADCTVGGCGDGFVNLTADEECDEGDDNSDTEPSACRTDCTLPYCGDGVVDTDEECDEGDDNSDTEPDACRSDCTMPTCGDHIVDSGESCDEGEDNSDTEDGACRTNCALASCGDGYIDSGEACDDGDYNSDVAANACRETCVVAHCGDGVLDTGEECDDGNAAPGDGCAVDCTEEEPDNCGGAGGASTCPPCNTTPEEEDDDGCSLGAGSSRTGSAGLWALALAALATLRRRRR